MRLFLNIVRSFLTQPLRISIRFSLKNVRFSSHNPWGCPLGFRRNCKVFHNQAWGISMRVPWILLGIHHPTPSGILPDVHEHCKVFPTQHLGISIRFSWKLVGFPYPSLGDFYDFSRTLYTCFLTQPTLRISLRFSWKLQGFLHRTPKDFH